MMDEKRTVIDNYNPLNTTIVNEEEQVVADNEQVVGFFGSDDKKDGDGFSRFGLIIKTEPKKK